MNEGAMYANIMMQLDQIKQAIEDLDKKIEDRTLIHELYTPSGSARVVIDETRKK